MDMTLKDFKNLSWVRGDLSVVFNGDRKFNDKIHLIDHEDKDITWIAYQVNFLFYFC